MLPSYLMDFLEIFTSGIYDRDVKTLPLTPSNSQFMAFLKNDKLIVKEGGTGGGADGGAANTTIQNNL